MTVNDLIDLACLATGLARARFDELRTIRSSDPEMNLIMKKEWNEQPRTDEAVIRDYYRKSDIWFVNTFESGYGGLLPLAAGEVHPLSEWQRRLVENLPKGGKILDYGSGFLRDSYQLVMNGHYVDVAEVRGPVTEFLKMYRVAAGLESRFGIIEVDSDLPITNTYDSMLCFEVLEHLLDPVAMTKNLYDHLAPGGPLAYSVSFGDPSHAPYHVASNAPLSVAGVWNRKLAEIGFVPDWENPENQHVKICRRKA